MLNREINEREGEGVEKVDGRKREERERREALRRDGNEELPHTLGR